MQCTVCIATLALKSTGSKDFKTSTYYSGATIIYSIKKIELTLYFKRLYS